MFKILFLAGLRVGELTTLKFSDVEVVSDKQLNVSVRRTQSMVDINLPKSQAGFRMIPIVDAVAVAPFNIWKTKLLNKLHNKRIIVDLDKQWLFPNPRGNDKPCDVKKPACRLASLIKANNLTPRISAHKARHSFISNLLIAGVDISTVQRLAGHSKPTMTLAVYAHISNEQREAAAVKLADYLGAVETVDSGNDSGTNSESTDCPNKR
ncbi:tyrosine-type recombinase/integrase [Lacticaseibacillus parakribbianus]|uniref:tyrosine-type recombinase/integrase n=1 Tax=Lacticaseibacillus parakribbianus TaxID=2970927 RepID=UPI0021CB32EC|nr:site-specific integrase [Lacticaseibacillus parakribbianus]